MRRAIKFRLIKQNKIVGYERFDHGEWYYSRDGSQWNEHFILHDDKDPYTGFKDKHGKEIYEEDLVTHPAFEFEEPPVGQVVFINGSFLITRKSWGKTFSALPEFPW